MIPFSAVAHAPRSPGNRAGLLAAIVMMKRAPTRSMPRKKVGPKPPTVLPQPKGSSIRFRYFWDRA